MPSKPYASISTIVGQPKQHLQKALTALCADDEVREKLYFLITKLAEKCRP